MDIRKLRRFTFLLLATVFYFVIFYPATFAERVEFDANADDVSLSVEESNDFRTVVRFEISAFGRQPVDINGKTYYSISCDGGSVMLNADQPALPRIS